MNMTTKASNLQVFVAGLLAIAFFLPLELTVITFFDNIIVSWLMTVLLIVWVQTATYSARNLRHFEGNDRWLLLIIAVAAPLIALAVLLIGIGQPPEGEDIPN